jgi:thiamine biosynthesis lipoprotein
LRKIFRGGVAAFCLALGFALGGTGCAPAPEAEQLSLSGPTMGTIYTVKVVAPPHGLDAAALKATIDEVLARVDASMSGYRADSEVSRFNASSSTEWWSVSLDLEHVVKTAIDVSASSGGAFDITVGPLVDAWGFGASGEPTQLPDEPSLAELKQRVGATHLQTRVRPPALRKDIATLTIDLNGIAPGYAVDLLADRLLALGATRFMIDIGGEVRAHGRNARNEPWHIAIERPDAPDAEPYGVLQLDGLSVSTSGEYRSFYVRDGKRYSHTIDPRTGRPVDHTLASVVVIGPSCMLTDAWATAFNVLGTEQGLALANRLSMAVMFIEWQNGQLGSRATPSFGSHLVSAAE